MPVSRPSQPWTVNTSSSQYTGLVAYWPGSASGGTVTDYIGTKHLTYEQGSDGTDLSLNIQTMPTIGGDCPLVADNGSTHPSLTYTPSEVIGVNDDFTISGWVNVADPGGVVRFLMIQGYENSTDWNIFIARRADRTVDVNVITTSGGATQYTAASASTLADNTTTLVTAVFDQGNYLRLFFDGTQVANTSVPATTLRAQTGGFAFPGRFPGTGLYTQSGYFADLRVYNRAMSNAEVAEMHTEATRWDLLTAGGGGGAARNRVIMVL